MSEELYLVKTLKPLKPCMGAKAKGFKVLKVLTELDINTGWIPGVKTVGWEGHEVLAGLEEKYVDGVIYDSTYRDCGDQRAVAKPTKNAGSQ